MLAVLRQRDFTLLWVASLISLTGDYVLMTALPYFVYQQTGSTLATGAMLLALILPSVMIGSVAGVFVDRWDRRRTMVVADLARAGLLLALLAVRSGESVWLIYVVAAAEATISQFYRPAKNALLPRLAGEERLVAANSLNALTDNVARLLGPPLGGLLVGLAGLPSVVALDSASYLLAGLLVAGIASSGLPATGDQAEDSHPPVSGLNRTWGEWRAGLQAVARDRVVVALFVILGLATFADSLNSALIVPFVADVIGGSALAFGWLLTAQGIGGLLGSALVGQVGRRLTPVALIVLGLWSGGALLLVLYNVPSLPLALALVFLAGVTTVGWSVSTQTLLQSTVADVYRGRVFGALGTTNGLLSLCGVGLASALGDLVGLLPVLNASGTLRIVAGVLALVLLRGGGAAWEIRAAGTGQGVPEVDRASDG